MNYLVCLWVSGNIKYINKSTGKKKNSEGSYACCSASVNTGRDTGVESTVAREREGGGHKERCRIEREGERK